MQTSPDGSTAPTSSQARRDRTSDEDLSVHEWRLDQLRRAGYEREDAEALADDMTVSLDAARRLVLERGCPPRLGARILL
jgi:hypothetical protein